MNVVSSGLTRLYVSDSGTLPSTGADTGQLVGLALLILGLGNAARLVARAPQPVRARVRVHSPRRIRR